MKTVWDRTNIGENYPGITLPLTYSFIRNAYGRVYESFLRLIGTPERLIIDNAAVVDNMLGYVRGRVYYRIENWHTFLTFLPGYRFNREFFESMLDPAEKKVDAPRKKIPIGLIESVVVLGRFIFLFFIPGILHKRFENSFARLYNGFRSAEIRKLDDEALIGIYEKTAANFFRLWAYTIVNDFRVMIYYGLLSKMVAGGEDAAVTQFLSHIRLRPESVGPIRQIIRMSIAICRHEGCKRLFASEGGYIWDQLKAGRYPNLKKMIDSYILRYGDRSANELKLEEPKFRERPELLIALLRQYVALGEKTLQEKLKELQRPKKNNANISVGFVKRILVAGLSRSAVTYIYLRENYRIRRGQVFGLARTVFVELGRRLAAAGDLEKMEDVFYLYLDELLDHIRHHRLPADLKNIVEERKKYLQSVSMEEPPRRLTTEGYANNQSIDKTPSVSYKKSEITGMGTARGYVTAQALVVAALDYNLDYHGKILVTKATDPGWTVLFPVLAGVVTERGGALSHASILARETGIPCIVQVENATDIVCSGDLLEMDGEKGTLRIAGK